MRRKNKVKPKRMRAAPRARKGAPRSADKAKAAVLTLSPLPRPARALEPEKKYSRIWP